MISFNLDWDTNYIIKERILVVKNLYTNLLEEILNKNENKNVILDSDKDTCLVYINDKYLLMDKKIILKETMKKLNRHLIYFLEEKKNILNNEIINILLETINNKYNNYLDNEDIQNNVNDIISAKYENVREEAQNIYNRLKI